MYIYKIYIDFPSRLILYFLCVASEPSFLADCWLTRQFHVIANNNSHATNDGWWWVFLGFLGVGGHIHPLGWQSTIVAWIKRQADRTLRLMIASAHRSLSNLRRKCGECGSLPQPLMLKIVPSKIMRRRVIFLWNTQHPPKKFPGTCWPKITH